MSLPGGVPAALLLGLLVLGSGCRFERRADLEENGQGLPATTGGEIIGPVGDSAIAVIEDVVEAVEEGDSTALRPLVYPGFLVFDEGGPGRPAVSPGATLGLRTRDGESSWELLESRVVAMPGVVVVFRRHRAIREGQSTPRTVSETWVLDRGVRGWRVRHLHRSHGLVGP